MNSLGRFDIAEISFPRLFSAIKVRLNEIPHTMSWNFQSCASENKENIQKIQGMHHGKRCFIVANGPSLLKTNLELLGDEITFGMNRIYLNFERSSFRPTYLVVVNELILEQWANEIAELQMPKFLNWNRRSYFGNSDPKITYLKSKMAIKDKFQIDLTRPVVFGATVTFVALQLAYFMGFHQVYLIGLDHNYKDKGIPSKTEIRSPDLDESHFHAQYFPKGYKWQLPDLLRSEIEFRLARNAFEADGREVFDATIGGKCQVFNKTDYRALFG
jgi:hypothetical protein